MSSPKVHHESSLQLAAHRLAQALLSPGRTPTTPPLTDSPAVANSPPGSLCTGPGSPPACAAGAAFSPSTSRPNSKQRPEIARLRVPAINVPTPGSATPSPPRSVRVSCLPFLNEGTPRLKPAPTTLHDCDVPSLRVLAINAPTPWKRPAAAASPLCVLAACSPRKDPTTQNEHPRRSTAPTAPPRGFARLTRPPPRGPPLPHHRVSSLLAAPE